MDNDIIGGSPQTCGQHSTEASSKHKIRQEKRTMKHKNTRVTFNITAGNRTRDLFRLNDFIRWRVFFVVIYEVKYLYSTMINIFL